MSKLVAITGCYNILPSIYRENYEFQNNVFNTNDTFMMVLGRTQHTQWEKFLTELAKRNIIINIIFDDKAVNCWYTHTEDTSLRQRIVIFEFESIPVGLDSRHDNKVPALSTV